MKERKKKKKILEETNGWLLRENRALHAFGTIPPIIIYRSCHIRVRPFICTHSIWNVEINTFFFIKKGEGRRGGRRRENDFEWLWNPSPHHYLSLLPHKGKDIRLSPIWNVVINTFKKKGKEGREGGRRKGGGWNGGGDNGFFSISGPLPSFL